ncbi:MAG: hypothetical protein JWL59_2568 [Chthoniobacteraceae bacterium]|nr:hypothetical protein [Chthoniobacteraceae bacterium]
MRAGYFLAFGLGLFLFFVIFNRTPAPLVRREVIVEIPVPIAAPRAREEPAPAATVPEETYPDLNLAPRLELQTGSLLWEDRVTAITQSATLTEGAKARELLRNLVSFPEEGLETATQEAVNRLPDKEFAAALGLLINPQTHGRVLQVLFADLLERPDEITLPALLSIARNGTHPFARQARDNLGLLVGKDLGTDWNRWDAEIRHLLKPSSL